MKRAAVSQPVERSFLNPWLIIITEVSSHEQETNTVSTRPLKGNLGLFATADRPSNSKISALNVQRRLMRELLPRMGFPIDGQRGTLKGYKKVNRRVSP
ncbi:hypothetical protein CC2G_006562 [Coprinopsis cinerea AmutBmut pab1-1]|nr:hypothetical protein CC2G_006562 [Coprinopsis cinerea AmutBmut pab1-1]